MWITSDMPFLLLRTFFIWLSRVLAEIIVVFILSFAVRQMFYCNREIIKFFVYDFKLISFRNIILFDPLMKVVNFHELQSWSSKCARFQLISERPDSFIQKTNCTRLISSANFSVVKRISIRWKEWSRRELVPFSSFPPLDIFIYAYTFIHTDSFSLGITSVDKWFVTITICNIFYLHSITIS